MLVLTAFAGYAFLAAFVFSWADTGCDSEDGILCSTAVQSLGPILPAAGALTGFLVGATGTGLNPPRRARLIFSGYVIVGAGLLGGRIVVGAGW
jgi:hypothetical protein